MQAKQDKILTNVAVMLKTQVIDAREICTKTLAQMCCLEEKVIIEILEGRSLTEDIAKKLEVGTTIPATAWIMVNNNDLEASKTALSSSTECFIINIDN